jgi:hypothetical protein
MMEVIVPQERIARFWGKLAGAWLRAGMFLRLAWTIR